MKENEQIAPRRFLASQTALGMTAVNHGGNKYRLIAAIHFNMQKLFVRHILTHSDYDTGRWKK